MADAPDRRTILVVEDEDPVRFVLTEVLEGEGYIVLATGGGEEALRVFADRPEVDLVVTDVAMPGMTGPQMVEAIRASRPDMRVILLSGYADETTRQGTRTDERTRYVQKPFGVDELAEVVRGMLDEAE